MPVKSPQVAVNPALLSWARESGGFSLEQVADGMKISIGTLRAWESGGRRPSFAELTSLADYYRRPVAALLLPEPPAELAAPADFRSLPGNRNRLAPETLLAIRRARRLQSLARELLQALNESVNTDIAVVNHADDPAKRSAVERSLLGVSLEDQFSWNTPYQAFSAWRDKLEARNVLVFQFPMPLEDCRGFSLAEQEPLTIVVNTSDAIHARIFTLFHEHGHLLLRAPGVCLPEVNQNRRRDDRADAESWCNRFAASLLDNRSLNN